MTHALSGSFDDTEGCTKCGCITCICDDATEYDVDGVYTAKDLAQEIREIIENWRGEQTDTTIVETILVHLQGAGL